MLKMYVNAAHTDWDTYLPRLLWAYRTAHQETLGDTPFFCMYGRDPIQPLHLAFVNQEPLWRSDELPQWRRKQSAWFMATRKLVEAQLLRGQNRDAAAKDGQRKVDYQPSDSVWVYQYFHKTRNPEDLRVNKFAYHWHGPYRIFAKQGDNTYRIYLPTHPDRVVPINVDRLKLFRGHWTRPFNDEIPEGYADPSEPSATQQATDDTILDEALLPTDSLIERIDFTDGDVAYSNASTPVLAIIDKRNEPPREVEYLVQHADGKSYWTPRSKLGDYTSFVTEYEDRRRRLNDLPVLRRSPRVSAMDSEAVVQEY
ncbi:hypothetical protein AaE_015743 [Aphanomyces astaci]|uniref:Integrase p58-like C-terminal domain-containing protein n=1 Tax=Aphanomyces astaci TaxID=112090 RepID=A0A6A4YZ29_APHAT|nr:hypothetical protein AaE_015743 [Aphanomyces astaci]